jgi:glutamate synthase (NADPH) small chain
MSICPRCKRELEDEEAYICCAGVELRWRCADCHKVSEGFAFPYGMCPHCKGKLELLDRDKIEGGQAMEAVRKAFEIELGGHAFYERAAREAADPTLRELFGRFAAMEMEHMDTLSKRYHASLPAAAVDFQLDRAAIFSGVDRRPEDPANLFRIAIAFEQRAVDFFGREGEKAPAGSVERELYKELAAEEREHVALLSTEFRRWEAGKAGIL